MIDDLLHRVIEEIPLGTNPLLSGEQLRALLAPVSKKGAIP
jgi:hypothetical protein